MTTPSPDGSRRRPATDDRTKDAATKAETRDSEDGVAQCFVLAPLGDADSDTRKRSDQILKHIITPVAVESGYKVLRADRMDQSGSITTQIINRILKADMVVADLTDHNPNVFYELAVRHAAAKPFVQIIQEGQSIPFDIANYRTIFINHRDLDSAASAKETLYRMFAESKANPENTRVDTPITQAVDFEGLRASGDPQQREIAHLSIQLRQLTQMVARRPRVDEDDSDLVSLRHFVTHLAAEGRLTNLDRDRLINEATSSSFDSWVKSLRVHFVDPWASSSSTRGAADDPWASPPSEEAPF